MIKILLQEQVENQRVIMLFLLNNEELLNELIKFDDQQHMFDQILIS
jgi:hypothetical protein